MIIQKYYFLFSATPPPVISTFLGRGLTSICRLFGARHKLPSILKFEGKNSQIINTRSLVRRLAQSSVWAGLTNTHAHVAWFVFMCFDARLCCFHIIVLIGIVINNVDRRHTTFLAQSRLQLHNVCLFKYTWLSDQCLR